MACNFSGEMLGSGKNLCSSALDCKRGVCDLPAGLCISENSQALTLGLEVLPATSGQDSAPLAYPFPTLELSSPQMLDLQLPKPVAVVGRVRLPNSSSALPAKVSFISEEAPAFLSVAIIETQTLATPQVAPVDGEMADYAVSLVLRGNYTVLVEPSGEAADQAPPLRFDQVYIPADSDAYRVDIQYPADSRRFDGQLVTSATLEGPLEPVDRLIIRAIDGRDGATVSSTAISGADATQPGRFTLWIDPSVSDFRLQVNASDEQRSFPTITFDPRFLQPATNGQPTIIRVPALTSVKLSGVVRVVDEAATAAVQGAVISLQGKSIFDASTGISGTFQTRTTSREDGGFSVEVLPGTYELVVTPARDTQNVQSGVLVRSVEASSEALQSLGDLLLPERFSITGTVSGLDEQRGLGGISVAAGVVRPNEEQAQTNAAFAYARSNETATNFLGFFLLSLDAGHYDVSIRPSADSGYPWLVMPNQAVLASDAAGEMRLSLPPPLPVRGVLRDATGALLAGAEVRAYVLEQSSPQPARAITVARAISDKDGKYTLLLAPR